MAIIVSNNGKDAVKLDPSEFQLEDHLQEYIHNNPEAIPLYEINEDIRLLVLAREFPTGSGPIDAIGVDQSGNIYLIETKLYRNNDKRLVVAQVLDYGASLWRHSIDFNEFISLLDAKSHRAFDMPLDEKLQEFFSIDLVQTEQLLANIHKCLNTGTFKFVVLMDKLHDRLRDLIVYMNSNSNFDIYAVELEYYRHKDFEIIIPHLYGAEVKKELKAPKKGLMLSDDEIIQEYADVGLRKQMEDYLAIYNSVKTGSHTISGISIAVAATKIISFIQPNDPYTAASISIYPGRIPHIEIWTIKNKERSVVEALEILNIEPIPMKKPTGKVGKIPLQSFDPPAFLKFLEALGQVGH
jgi:hypothetical protein